MAAVTDPSIWEAETAEGASERAAARAAERAASVAAERIAMQDTKAGDVAPAGRSFDSPRTMILRRALGLPTMRCDDRFTMNRWR